MPGSQTSGAPASDIAGFSAVRLARIGVFMNAEIEAGRIPGAALMIERHGVSVLREVWGRRDAAAGTAMTRDTIFRIYSMTKPIVSLAAMMLAEEGALRLAQPVAELVPAFANVFVGRQKADGTLARVEPGRAMTVQDLLRHTSGITYGTAGELPMQRLYRDSGVLRGDFTNEEFAARLAALPLAYEPGTTWDYSHSTDILGRVVEVAAGALLGTVLRQKILGPLGMAETAFHVADPAQHCRIAEAFDGDTPFGAGTRLSNPRIARKFESGGGGLVSTLDDYARFARMLLNRGTLDGTSYVSPRTLAFMASDHIGSTTGIARAPGTLLGPGFGFGLGFAVRTDVGAAPAPGSVGEFNWSGIAGTCFWIDPKEDLFVVFLMQAPNERDRFRAILRSLIYGALFD